MHNAKSAGVIRVITYKSVSNMFQESFLFAK